MYAFDNVDNSNSSMFMYLRTRYFHNQTTLVEIILQCRLRGSLVHSSLTRFTNLNDLPLILGIATTRTRLKPLRIIDINILHLRLTCRNCVNKYYCCARKYRALPYVRLTRYHHTDCTAPLDNKGDIKILALTTVGLYCRRKDKKTSFYLLLLTKCRGVMIWNIHQ